MELKSLMVDDFVQVVQNGKKIVAKIQCMDCYADNASAFECICDGIYYSENEISPIPITDEFLEKNFEFEESKSLYNSYRLELSDEECIFIDFHEKRKYIRFTYDNDRVCGTTIIILRNLHIHELQHALRLVGLSEIADNLKV